MNTPDLSKPNPDLSKPRRGFSRRKFLACAGLGGLGLAGYTGLVEPFRLEIGRHEYTTRFPQPGNKLKLLHLSDFHASWVVSLGFIERAIALGLSLQPDLICLTGDYITHKYEAFADYAKVLAKLCAAAPVFACLGNHDGGHWAGMAGGYATTEKVRQLLRQSHIELLDNRLVSLRIKGRNLKLIGVNDSWSEAINAPAAFSLASLAHAETRILLSHNPDSKDFLKYFPWDLLLSGHTHGGQAVFPFLGAGFFAPVKDKRYIAGLLPWENRWIHITRGVGNVHGLRFNCPPEVSLITLV
jgi:hypothetical protein